MRAWLGVFAFATLGTTVSQAGDVQLFNGKDLSGWTAVHNMKGLKPEDVWTVENGVLKCKGTSAGYIRTKDDYQNYILTLEWRWTPGTKGGNSGVLLHTVGKDDVWPKSIEAQLQAGSAGDIWLIGGATIDVKDVEKRRRGRQTVNLTDGSENKIGEWNRYVIVCCDKTISLIVNGDLVNYGWNASLTKGAICLQAEGAPIEFRNIVLHRLEP